jgi:hypothetical protein
LRYPAIFILVCFRVHLDIIITAVASVESKAHLK